MKVLLVHNRYQQAGGEDSVIASEAALLQRNGFTVETHFVDNDHIMGIAQQAKAAFLTPYNPMAKARVQEILTQFKPDVMHVHNFFPQLSPSIFDAAKTAGVPSVMTLHNFRLTCANGILFRQGKVCEKCVGRSILPAIRHRCYRGSVAGSATVSGMIAFHRARKTWHHKVDRFIALTEFGREKYIEAGLPAEKIVVKPNFVDPAGTDVPTRERSGFIYVGRLSTEKGLHTLLKAWETIKAPLTIVGDGPEREALESIASKNITFTGSLPRDDVLQLVARAKMLVFPSAWYEAFGMVVIEAMAAATPVLASKLGGPTSIIAHGIDGLLFKPGDADDLRLKVQEINNEKGGFQRLGIAAKATYEARYAPDKNFERLSSIYRSIQPSPMAIG